MLPSVDVWTTEAVGLVEVSSATDCRYEIPGLSDISQLLNVEPFKIRDIQQDARKELRKPQGRTDHLVDCVVPEPVKDVWAEAGDPVRIWHRRLGKSTFTDEVLGNIVAKLRNERTAVFWTPESGLQTEVRDPSSAQNIIVPNKSTMLLIVENIVKKELRRM